MLRTEYSNDPKYWGTGTDRPLQRHCRQTFANSVNPDQTLHNAASDQGLPCLPLIQQYFRHIKQQ